MKAHYYFRWLTACLVLAKCLFLTQAISAANHKKDVVVGQYEGRSAADKYVEQLGNYAQYAEVLSGGHRHGNRVVIRIGNHTFYDYDARRIGLSGIYVVAIYNNKVLLQYHYNTYFFGGASLGFSRDISKLPYGTFVVVAAKGEPTRLFDEDGQKTLYQIGAGKGLLNQKSRTSYLCIGVKGLARGKAIEKMEMEQLKHIGAKAGEQINFVFPKKKEPQAFSRMPGRHEGLMFGDTEVIYYIPKNFDPDTAQYLFGIHGAGPWRRPGALNRIAQFRNIADKKNLVIIAPAFTDVLNRNPNFKKDIKNGKFIDPKMVKDRRSFMMLLNKFNEDRSDLKLIEIFEFFNENLMRREKFHLYGHSGGGQFVNRFITFYPELIDKVAASSPGTFTFPRRDKDYPWGLKMDNLEKTFGPQIEAEDLHLSNAELDQKMNRLLDLQLFLIVGEEETTVNHPDLAWQGKGTLHKTRNYFEAMREEDKRLKDKGIRSRTKPFQFELHVMPGVGHSSAAGAKKAIELLFPAKKRVQGYSTIPAHANFPANVKTSRTTVTPVHSPPGRYLQILQDYSNRTKAVSGAHRHGNQVYIRVDDYTFFSGIPDGPATAGLYVVAICNDVVRLQSHYNTFQKPRASGRLARHIDKLPDGTFVAIAAKGEPTRLFNEKAQKALYQIGAGKGLLNQKPRTSYLCLGVKGLARGKAIERVGMELLKFQGAEAGKYIDLQIGSVKEAQIPSKKTLDPNDKYGAEFATYAGCSEVVSSGPGQGDHLLIRVGKHTFYNNILNCTAKAGLYVVGIYKNQVLLQRHYNTSLAQGASLGLSLDISKLPNGTFVVVATNNEATRFLDKKGQNALRSIGAETGLLKIQGTSYLCLGIKGMGKGRAIEKLGIGELKYTGREVGKPVALTFPKKAEPRIQTTPGKHEGLMIGDTEAIYYIPKYFDPNTAKYLFGIHGAGPWHRAGALNRIAQFRRIADIENLVLIAPAFCHIYNWPVVRNRDVVREEGQRSRFRDPRIIKDWYLANFIMLLNSRNEYRTDLKLIEIFDFFNRKLMKREKFYLDGHSGGGQFVARFVLFHPELIDKAAICSAGSFVFPNRDKDYPYGLKLDNLEKTFGPQIQADDLKLNDEQINQKLNQMLDLKIFIIAGERETKQENRPRRDWQGKSTLEKAKNFYKAMKEEGKTLKQKGIRSSSKPYPFELHIIPDVGHNSGATAGKAIELLFPTREKTKGQILYIDFSKGVFDKSGNANKIESKSRPTVYRGSAIFDSQKKQYLHILLNEMSDLIGCTEMTIRVLLRIKPHSNQNRRTWIVHTSDYHKLGTALVLDKNNQVNAWIHTISPEIRPLGEGMQLRYAGKSPTLTSKKRIDDGQWHDIRLTYTGREVMLFIDKVLQEKLEWKGALVNAGQINIGYLEQHRSYFNGEIAKIEVYGRSILP